MKRSLSALVVGGSLMLMSGVATAQYGPGEPPPSTSSTTAPEPTTTVPETTTTSVLGTTIVPEPTTTTAAPGTTSTTVLQVANPTTSSSAPQVLGVTAERGSLARTGQDALPLLAVGAGLVGAGTIFVVASRRKGAADAS